MGCAGCANFVQWMHARTVCVRVNYASDIILTLPGPQAACTPPRKEGDGPGRYTGRNAHPLHLLRAALRAVWQHFRFQPSFIAR